MFSPQSIVYAWDNGLRYALALLEDLTDEQMLLRPGGNMNHPAWILGHMSLYYPIVPALLRGESFPDPADDDLFGFRGRGPQDDLALYGTKAAQLDRMTTGHEQVAQALAFRRASPTSNVRRASRAGVPCTRPSSSCCPICLLLHENIHIGQLSIWRRAAGLPAVEFPDRTPRAGLI